jgi:ubiquinone/menaquinone biosynthesis C-methylase UbiE
MLWKISNGYWILLAATVALVVGTIAWRFAFFIAPFAWTREPARLAGALALRPGVRVADIGAGSGELAIELASLVGDAGMVYATELAPDRRAAIEGRIRSASVKNVRVIAGAEDGTRLPDACCDAVYMRAVFHHIRERPAFAASVARAVRPGGRVAIIDFAPGTLWFHGADHGVERDAVIAAFQAAGLRLREQADDWGGGMFMVVFERQ